MRFDVALVISLAGILQGAVRVVIVQFEPFSGCRLGGWPGRCGKLAQQEVLAHPVQPFGSLQPQQIGL